jgi:hypothetical protein
MVSTRFLLRSENFYAPSKECLCSVHDADGNLIKMDTKNIDGKKVLMMKMPTASVYALTYAAKAAGDITIKVTQIINRGDVNNDGIVDIADAVCIVNHIVGKPTQTFIEAAGDLNSDGEVDIADAVHIVNYIVGKVNTLAPRKDFDQQEPE